MEEEQKVTEEGAGEQSVPPEETPEPIPATE